MRRLFKCAIVALALLPMAATAQTLPEVVTRAERDYTNSTAFRRTVSIRDIDVAAPGAVREIMSRVRAAAWDGCSDIHRDQPLTQTLTIRGICVRASVASARPQIDRILSLASIGQYDGTQVAVTGQR